MEDPETIELDQIPAKSTPEPSLKIDVTSLVTDTALHFGIVAAIPIILFDLATIPILIQGFGLYGTGMFVAFPFVVGVVAGIIRARQGFWSALRASGLIFLIVAIGLLVYNFEGLICIAMALPLALALAALGIPVGSGAWQLATGRAAKSAILLLTAALTPCVIAAESKWPRTPPVYQVTSSIEIDVPPSVVWPHVVAFPPIPEPMELTFRAGIAYPIAATMRLEGTDRIRECVFNTGTIVEPVEIWEPPYRLRFAVTEMPEPMIETGLYGELHPPHLNGYLMAKHGEFVLTELPGGRTRVDGTSWYSHGLWPAWYWRLWSDELIHSIHNRVLRHIKTLAEAK